MMKRAMEGKELTIAAIGGSITAGANASNFQKTSYSALVYNWWVAKFPEAKFKYVNAGIGATTSVYGVHRAERDLLKFNPDFTIVDFSVNDNGIRKECAESYEGLIRKIFINRPNSAILSIAMVDKKIENVEDAHSAICKQYQIPMLSVKQVIQPLIKSGRITWNDWSVDDVHPNDKGHELIADLIIAYLEECYKETSTLPKPYKIKKLVMPVTENGFQNSGVFDAVSMIPANMGNWAITKETGYWKNSWITNSQGNPLIFNVKAKSLIIGYKKNTTFTNGRLFIKVDGLLVKELDPNFVNGWGSYIANELIFKNKKSTNHTIELEYKGNPGEPIFITYLLIAK
jgi:lysophospholipase L1-like esterase